MAELADFDPSTGHRHDCRAVRRSLPCSCALQLYEAATAPPDIRDRTDLGDGRCTNHPSRCMIPGCDHTAEPQRTRDAERWDFLDAAG